MNQDYQGLFKDWEVGVAINVIRDLKDNWKWLERVDEEDLLQECLAQWVFARDRYDPNGSASKSTYMARVVRNKLIDIAREQSSDKRKAAYKSTSIHQSLNDEDEDSSSLLDIHAFCPDFSTQAELSISIEQAFSQLTDTQKALCRYLRDGYSNMTELGKILGISRASVYREVGRIRYVFKKEGLKDFLK